MTTWSFVTAIANKLCGLCISCLHGSSLPISYWSPNQLVFMKSLYHRIKFITWGRHHLVYVFTKQIKHHRKIYCPRKFSISYLVVQKSVKFYTHKFLRSYTVTWINELAATYVYLNLVTQLQCAETIPCCESCIDKLSVDVSIFSSAFFSNSLIFSWCSYIIVIHNSG